MDSNWRVENSLKNSLLHNNSSRNARVKTGIIIEVTHPVRQFLVNRKLVLRLISQYAH
jgi:hypothetical protein